MKLLSIISVGVYMMAFVFMTVAVASSSRPDKMRRRALEFGLYFAVIVALTIGNVPGAMITTRPGVQLDDHVAVLTNVRTWVVTVVYLRLGVILLKGYGQREALKKHIAALEGEQNA